MNILLNYLIIGIVRRLFMQIIINTKMAKLGFDEFDTITRGSVDSNNQNIAEIAMYSWKSVLFHIVAWPICIIVEIVMMSYYLYRLFKKD